MKEKVRPKCTETTWVTREGEEIPVVDMEDSHLYNTVRFLRRKVAERIASAEIEMKEVNDVLAWGPPAFQGEMAQYHAEGEYYTLFERLWTLEWLCGTEPDALLSEQIPTWNALVREADRRGLEI